MKRILILEIDRPGLNDNVQIRMEETMDNLILMRALRDGARNRSYNVRLYLTYRTQEQIYD